MFLLAMLCMVSSISLYAGANSEDTGKKEVEVFHWWTSGSEAVAWKLLQQQLAEKGIAYVDFPVVRGEQALNELRVRVSVGNPPTAAQMLGFSILDWAELGASAQLDDIAKEEGWDEIIPEEIKKFSKYKGKWVSVPVNIHSTNWLWMNNKLLDKLNIAIPTTWDEYVTALERVKSSGKIALAHGGEAWQNATLFDGVALATGGPFFYKKALIDLDITEINSVTMEAVFDRMTVLRSYVDDNFLNRSWDSATAMVINGEAAFQMMGDWVKGEFRKAGMLSGNDFIGVRTPNTQGSVLFSSDQFFMFRVDPERELAQKELVKTMMNASFQEQFSMIKGSVPARTDIIGTSMDSISQKGIQDVISASNNESFLGSMAHGYAVTPAVQNAMYDVITRHFNGEYSSSKQAVQKFIQAIQSAW